MPKEDQLKKHIELLGILQIAFGSILFLIGIIGFAILQGTGLIAFLAEKSGDGILAMRIMTLIAWAVLFLALLVALPLVLAGIGLMKRRRWARILTLIISAINLLNMPLGTVLAIYAFWVLMNQESIEYLSL